MIIVSQDKRTIFNMKNVEAIGIGCPLENNEGKFLKLANTSSDNQYTIAEYNTEERAKEVSQEIVKFYEVSERFKCSSNNGITIFIQDTFVYEMPGE